MSTCISRHGEFGEHTLDDSHTCTRCYVLDEEALRAALAAVEQDRDKLSDELTVVRRERAWLLQLVGYDELQEFRLLAQTAERAREDAAEPSGTEAGQP